ncbi:MAG: hypothetical protein COX19_08600 [Desulfobacterales bacterium CG23_combo_of_CG06-09_8_20_14_all_51_8]|nr:MAG: hypothetical protein COX19_08600 [Desulfobacterales bacterium CG23_combo_of_CG06-09_8_20_14_all_51_8]
MENSSAVTGKLILKTISGNCASRSCLSMEIGIMGSRKKLSRKPLIKPDQRTRPSRPLEKKIQGITGATAT